MPARFKDYELPQSQPLCVEMSFEAQMTREALQLDRRLPTIQSDVGIAVAHVMSPLALQVGERLAFQIQLVVAGHEIGDDGRCRLWLGN